MDPKDAPAERQLRFAGWRQALREFVVIVAGVLAALAAQAWWEARSDSGREREYLLQLLADTRENEERIADAIATDSLGADSGRRLMIAMNNAAPLPQADSLLDWFNHVASSSDFQPVTGTYRALLGTGDLRLVRTDTLRSMLTSYVATLEAEAERLEQLRGTVLAAVGSGARSMPFLRRAFAGGLTPADVPWDAVRRNDDALAVIFTMQATNVNRLNGLRALRRHTSQLRAALEAEMRR